MKATQSLHTLALQAQYDSLAHGGIAHIQAILSATPEQYQVYIQIPGVAANKLRVEILNRDMLIYSHGHALTAGADTHHRPVFMHMLSIPEDVDRAAIQAQIRGQALYIDMPRVAGGGHLYHRVLPIGK